MNTQDNLQEADGLLEEKKEKTTAKDAVDQAVKKRPMWKSFLSY